MQLRFILQKKNRKKKQLGRHDFQFLIVYLTVLSNYILNVLYMYILESSKHINLAGKCLLENKWMLYSVSLKILRNVSTKQKQNRNY